MDYGFFNWMDKIRNFYPFTRKELLWIGLSVLIVTFIVGFDDGNKVFNIGTYSANMLVSLIAVLIAVIIHESAHRIAAPMLGYKVEFKPFFFGLLGGLILAFMSYGKFMFLAYGSFFLNVREKHRLGYFRHYLGHFDNGKVAVTGPLANLFAAMVFKGLVFLPEALISKIVFINVLFAITNMLPIPPLDGAHVMYSSRHLYPFTMAAIIGAGVLLLLPGVTWWMAIIGAIALAIFYSFFYFNVLEKAFGNW
jgi:Zn-dependent protease